MALALSVDITPAIANKVWKYAKSKFPDIEIIVAPFEADPQLVYLNKTGYVDAIITVDSDIMTYGGKTIMYSLEVKNEIFYLVS